MASGSRANRSGRVLENVVESVFQTHGYRVLRYSEWNRQPDRFADESRLLLKNVPYTTIYGHQGRSEFVVVVQGEPLLRIECKWQQSPGSVDEKFPYLYLNAAEMMEERTVLIIVDGGGAKPRAIEWLRRAAQERLFLKEPDKMIRVMNQTEFVVWANLELPVLGSPPNPDFADNDEGLA